MEVKRNDGGRPAQYGVKGQGQLDVPNRAAQNDGIAAHAFGDDDAFIEVPLLGVGRQEEHQASVFAHAAEAFAAAQHEPHIGGFEGNLSFFGFKVVAGHGSYALKLDAFNLGN